MPQPFSAGPASTPRVASPPLFNSTATPSHGVGTVRSRRAGGTKGKRSSGKRSGVVEDEGVATESEVNLSMLRWGYALVAGSTLALFVGTWSILIGPYTEPSGIKLFDALAEDSYYKYLVVLLIPVTTVFVIVNWWGLKIFRHS